MADVKLSTINPDFESILSQIQSYVYEKDSWLTLRKSNTAALFLEAIAMVGEYDQYSIMSALHETTLEDAKIPESIYTNSRFLGVRISRKTPAECLVTLQNSDLNNLYVEIPAYTQFDIEGTKYFNREALIFSNIQNIVNTTLYQGEIKQALFTSNGSKYQSYVLEESIPWTISDEDIICIVNNYEIYTRSTDPIYLFNSTDKKFYENTLPTGQVEIKFGNGIYGNIPGDSQSILFKYATTTGSQGNNSISGLKVNCSEFSQIIGETTSNSYNGSDEKDVIYYQQLGAAEGASNGRGIIRDDFKSLVLKYPGVIDCNVYGQAEIAPNDKSWMNVVALMLLVDESSFNDNSFKGLVKYLKSKSIFGLQFIKLTPEVVPVSLDITLYLYPGSDLTACKNKAIEAISNYTKLQIGSLGKSLYMSDIEDIIFSALPKDIDYISKESPLVDYVITKNQYIKIISLDITVAYSSRNSQNLI